MNPADQDEAIGLRSRQVLEEEREFFLRSLRDLEAERAAGDIDDLDYHGLRDDYTTRAAAVLRQLAVLDGVGAPVGASAESVAATVPAPAAPVGASAESLAAAAPPAAPRPAAVPGVAGDTAPAGDDDDRRPSPWRRRVLPAVPIALIVGGACVVAVSLLAPGPSTTDRVNSLDVAAQVAISGRTPDPVTALRDYDAALRLDPNNPVALTGEGYIFTNVGGGRNGTSTEFDLGLSLLLRAETVDPSYGPAYGYRGIALYNSGDDKAAVPQLRTYLADTPKLSQNPQAQIALQRAEARQRAAS